MSLFWGKKKKQREKDLGVVAVSLQFVKVSCGCHPFLLWLVAWRCQKGEAGTGFSNLASCLILFPAISGLCCRIQYQLLDLSSYLLSVPSGEFPVFEDCWLCHLSLAMLKLGSVWLQCSAIQLEAGFVLNRD